MTDKGHEFLSHWIKTSKDPDILEWLETQALKNGSIELAFLARARKKRYKETK